MAETRIQQLARQSRVFRRLAQDPDGTGPALPPFLDDLDNAPVVIRCYRGPEGEPLSWDRELRAADLTHVVVKRGREAAGETPGPGTLTFGVRVRTPDDLAIGETGRRLWFRFDESFWEWISAGAYAGGLDQHGNDYHAFVTDAQLTYVSAGKGRPPRPVLNVTATGPKARAASTRIGDVPWPQEGLKWRRNRIYNEIQWAAFPSIGNPFGNRPTMNTSDGDLVVAARDVDAQDPVGLLDSLAADVGAILTESTKYAGQVLWHPIDFRANEDPVIELTADEVALTATWGKSLNGLVNRYTVEYGPAEARAQVEVIDQASIDAYGDFAASKSTELVNRADAERLAALIVGRNSRPRWTITRFDVDLLDLKLPRAKAYELLGRGEVGELLTVAGLPGSAPAARYFHLEGTELRVSRHDLTLTVYVSDAGQTGAPPTWERLPADLTWDQVDPTMTWLQAAGWFLEPVTAGYRWLDVPADARWIDLSSFDAVADSGDQRVPTWESYPDDPTP